MVKDWPHPTAPTLGDFVLYTLTEQDAYAINQRRTDGDRARASDAHNGVVIHSGNSVIPGDVFPALVVRVWESSFNSVNLHVFLDGIDTYWATSKSEGDEPGTWAWSRSPATVHVENLTVSPEH
ncbi:hypothetical protein ACLQ2R_03255 [Streptosporangium sp. DT93]|uniref:hypothetical protein n=1 Tax=Streptosporangium sp. DT93 TaxID=3393428 RepID=UPI003CEB3DAE